jgi:integrase
LTTFKHPQGTTWRYDFWWKGRRYTGSTDQLTKADADLVESEIKKRLRQQAWGIAPVDRLQTPTFSKWAGVYFEAQGKRLTRADILDRTLRMVLGFWGTKPAKDALKDAPYHDLRLADPILDPVWLERFEQWMAARGIEGSTKNSYRSAVSGMYKLAMKPQWRAKTNITANPMLGGDRDPSRSRKATLTPAQIKAWIGAAPTHVALALAIGVLAPKLRKASILALRWDRHFDPDLRFITVHEHKTIRSTGEPQIVPIDPQLRAILLPFRDAANRTKQKHVITFRGEPVKDIKRGLATAADVAGIPYGRANITFHSLRHTMATMMAEIGIGEQLRKAVMGHKDVRTTQGYTHLRPMHERAPLAALSSRMALKGLVQEPTSAGRERSEQFRTSHKPAKTSPIKRNLLRTRRLRS